MHKLFHLKFVHFRLQYPNPPPPPPTCTVLGLLAVLAVYSVLPPSLPSPPPIQSCITCVTRLRSVNNVTLSCSGVYSPDDYHVAVPMAVILLPSEGIVSQSTLFSALPSDLQYYLQQKVREALHPCLLTALFDFPDLS